MAGSPAPGTRVYHAGNPAVTRQTGRSAKPLYERRKTAGPQAGRNQARILRINWVFVFILILAVSIVIWCCFNYLRLRLIYTTVLREAQAKESEIAKLKEYNDAYYAEVISSTDLEQISKIATEKLGMHPPTDDQIRIYTVAEGGSYVRQYQDLP
ncbi:MAG: cell division protein FtsL [Blautia sp.]|nr:cell division protein FtsL [Blautia sp.]